MSNIKLGINIHLPVTINGIENDAVQEIAFLFKQRRDPNAEALKCAAYKADGSGDVRFSDGVYYVPFSREDTYRSKPQTPFYLDTRITLKGTTDNPLTPITQLVMDTSLFGEGDDL